MQILPSGLAVPPLPYLLGLAVATAALAWRLSVRSPAVGERHVLAFTPWMVAGGGAHAIYQQGLVPDVLEPLAAAPAVYVTTAVLAGATWVAALGFEDSGDGDATARGERVARDLGVVGLVATLALAAVAYGEVLGSAESTRQYAWPVVGFLGAAAVTAPAYYLLSARWERATERVGLAGPLVVYAHALDGVSTAIGIDLIGTGERSPLPARIMEFAGELPTEPYLGRGWLFVLVKIAVAGAIVLVFADYVEENPTEGNLLLVVVTAVGVGPAANNLFLFLLGA